MGLETGTFVGDLVTTNPVGASDERSTSDDHHRLIKSVLKTTFSNAVRAFRFPTAAAAKTGAYSIVANDANSLVRGDVSGGAFTITLPLLSNVFAGFIVAVMKSDSGSNVLTVDGNGAETINGSANHTLRVQYSVEVYISEGTEWKVIATGFTFPTGTSMLFRQTTAPVGWTKQSINDKALRVVSGTVGSGGATAFTTVFGSSKVTGSHVLSVGELPAHNHTQRTKVGATIGNVGVAGATASNDQDGGATANSTGGGGGHTHTLSLDLQYQDVIIADKD